MTAAPSNGATVDLTVPLPVPGGVAAPNRETLYVTASPSGVQAVELESGAVRWTSAVAALPLLATPSVVVATATPSRREALVLVTLDAATGAEISRSRALSTPPEQWGLCGIAAMDGSATVWWDSHPYFGGARPNTADTEAMGRSTRHARALTLATGATRPVGDEMPAVASFSARSGGGIPDADGALLRWTLESTEFAVLVRRATDGDSSLVLSGGAVRHTLLSPAPPVGYVDLYLADLGARLLLLVTNDARDGHAPPGTVLVWHVFSVPDGKALGSLPFSEGTELPPAVLGDRFLMRSADGVLHCIDLASGEERWAVATAGLAPAGKKG